MISPTLTTVGFEVCRECRGRGQLSTGIGDGMTYCHVCQTGEPYWTDEDRVITCMVNHDCSEAEARVLIKNNFISPLKTEKEG